jgi:hypothetical protein
VVAERAVQARVIVEERPVEEADVRKERIQADCGVALAEDEAVAVGPVRLVRPIPQDGVIERCEELGRGERRGVVAGTRDAREPHRLDPDELRPVPQPGDQLFALPRSPWGLLHRDATPSFV